MRSTSFDGSGKTPKRNPAQSLFVDADSELAERIRAYPRRRTYLLPALHDVQDALGWLSGDALEMVGGHLRVPKSEVYGIASSFPDFRLLEPAEHVSRICTGAACRLAGAQLQVGVDSAD